ncbi:hypothetical protein [Coleofasciculus sp. G2-EDA-02]|uniref:hypothetical protein n=1 Tax=Coleofasciculus sp. G2-EDA-02 TaxID=3069529 RepID=UPI0032F38932
MISRFIEFLQSQRQPFFPWRLPLTGLLLTLGLTMNVSSRPTAVAQQLKQAVDSAAVEPNQSTVSASATLIPDGTYLYGQSSQPDQIGQEYIVFQANKGKLVGALYLPQSEFSCFYGTLESKQMNLQVVNPYDQTALAHTIENQQQTSVAAGSQLNLDRTYESLTYPYTVRLDQYQPVGQLSENDQRMLNICRENLF